MTYKLIILAVAFLVLLVPAVAADVEYTGTSKTECYDSGRCYTTRYGGTVFAQNSLGKWADASDVLSISKNEDDITFTYDGIRGIYSITFEAGVHYNGNYYSFSEVRLMKPLITFDFPVEDYGSHKKYDVIIRNLDELDIEKIENITLTYKSHFGFTLDKLRAVNRRFNIKDFVSLSFEDLFNKHPIDIKMNERRLYIANITDNIIDGVLELDPNLFLDTATSEIIDDTYVLQKLPDTNRGVFTTMPIELEGTTEVTNAYIKFNMTDLPVGVDVLWANLSFWIETNDGQDFNVSAWELDNQTWEETELTWNKKPNGLGGYINNAHNDNTLFTTRFDLNVTEWVATEHTASKTFVSFFLNGTFNGLAAGSVTFYTKEFGGREPWLNITYQLGVPGVPGLNVSVFNAVNLSIVDPWSVTINNGSLVLTSNNNINPAVFNISLLPTGASVNVTIFKPNFANVTYQIPIDTGHTENLTAFIFRESRGLITIHTPTNSSTIGGLFLTINITAPGNISGDLNNLDYELNASGNFISLCTDCFNFSGTIPLGGFGSQDLLIRATNTFYRTWYEEVSFTNIVSAFNLSILDELTNVLMDFSLVESANFTAFCPLKEVKVDITGNFTQGINIDCEFDYVQLEMKLHNQSAEHFRTLIPEFSDGAVTFYMMDNITKDPDTNFIDVKLSLEDLTGDFFGGIVHLTKAIDGSIVDIIDKQVWADAAINAYLIINERYFLSVESADGLRTKSLGDFTPRSLTDTDTRLKISDLDIFPPLIDFITWEFFANSTELFINFTYDDTQNLTNLVTFRVFNITDPTDKVLVFTSTGVDGNFSFTFSTAVFNNTYLAEFIANHSVFGNLTETRIIIFSDRLFPLSILEQDVIWYTIISIFIIMMTALMFGARAASIGAVIVAIEAAFFVLIGWLDMTIPIISLVALIAVLSAIGYRRREQ